MADLKKLIADYNAIHDEHGSSADVLKKRNDELAKQAETLRKSVSFPGLKNITATSGYGSAIVFEIVGVKDVTIHLSKKFSLSSYKNPASASVSDEFSIRLVRESFGSYNEPTSIFNGTVHAINVANASKLGSTESKMIDDVVKVCQIIKAFNEDAFSTKGKIYAELVKWTAIDIEMHSAPEEDVKTAQEAKEKLGLAKAAVFAAQRQEIINELSTKGVKFKSLPQNVSFANANKNLSAIDALFPGTRKYNYGQNEFVALAVGLSYPKAVGTSNLYPLFWNKATGNSFECEAFVLAKTNAKSVSIVANEVSSSDLSKEKISSAGYNQKFITEYSSRNGTDMIPAEPKGTKQIKTATSLERLVSIAIAYNPSLLTKDFLDFYEATKK